MFLLLIFMIPKATAPARAARICNDVQQVRMLCFGGIDGQGCRRVASQGVNGGGGRDDRTHRFREMVSAE